MSPQPSTLLRELAARMGVDLSTVTGTGAGGAITKFDVQNAAARQPSAARARAAQQAPAKRPQLHARNPLLDELRIQGRSTAGAAGSAPTLFASGDLPPYTASGNPPSELLRLPWQLRHAAAKADQREWSRLFSEYADNPEADIAILYEPAACDPANDEYRARFAAWRMGRPVR